MLIRLTINGTLSVNGNSGTSSVPNQYLLTEPGPGGFRGGAYNSSLGEGDGLGPGGGLNQNNTFNGGYQSSYGNAQIVPLIGGSGASGYTYNYASSGGSGGGAILIAAGGTVTINGQITATPGKSDSGNSKDSGAGGGIRVVANQIAGNGAIDATPQGRTRVEANSLSFQLSITPNVALVSPGTMPVIFPPANSPTVRIVSLGGQTAPTDPRVNVVSSPDVSISTNAASAVTVILQTQNFPTTGTISVRVTPVFGNAWTAKASFLSGNATQAQWQLTAPIPLGYCVLQAHATIP
jgi:hypothetical protein